MLLASLTLGEWQAKATEAASAFTDDDLRAIVATLVLPGAFKKLCASFQPPLQPSSESMEKYLSVKLSNNSEAIRRFNRLVKAEGPNLGKKLAEGFLERYKGSTDDPFARLCNEIVERVGPKGTEAPGLLVEVEDQPKPPTLAPVSSEPVISEMEAAMDEANVKVRRASDNDLLRDTVEKENRAKLCPLADRVAAVTEWTGKIDEVSRYFGGGETSLLIKVRIGEKFETKLWLANTPENNAILGKATYGDIIKFTGKLDSASDPAFCFTFMPSWTGYRFEKDQLSFIAYFNSVNDGVRNIRVIAH